MKNNLDFDEKLKNKADVEHTHQQFDEVGFNKIKGIHEQELVPNTGEIPMYQERVKVPEAVDGLIVKDFLVISDLNDENKTLNVKEELNKKADKTYVKSEISFIDGVLMEKADISFVKEEIKQSEVYFNHSFLNFMKSSDKTFDIDSFEGICYDGVTTYLLYTAGVLYYLKTNDFKKYESFTPSVLDPYTQELINNPRILYVEHNNGKFIGMTTVRDDFCPCYSFDCIKWFKYMLNPDVAFKYPNNPIRFVNNKWILIYEYNQIFISEDGLNYSSVSVLSDLEIDYTSKWYYTNCMYFILQNDKIYRSSSIPQGDGDIEALCYGSNVYVLVSGGMVYSYPVSYNRHIYLSQDLSNWELVYSFTPKLTRNYRFCNLFYIDGYFIALGCGDLVNISNDGRTWSEITKFQDVRKAIFKNNTLILITRPVLNTRPNSILYNKFNIHDGLNTKADKTELQEMKRQILETLYPIGSIYTSMNSTNPSEVFGFGTWQQITDKFLYCANSSKQTGGSKTITGENLPAHSHYIDFNTQDSGWNNHSAYNRGWNSVSNRDSPNVQVMSRYELSGDPQDWNSGIGIGYAGTHNHRITGYTQTTGQSKDYMPPYMTVFAWYRVA
ncbi:hypothetical protein TVAG_167670 [Trichomonas vaginalis G3]|uniref:Baseplate structural protein Gp10 C-terminal domain-containing protein n=1 Tax=Trichomonas vaginalis (strain ATCC PRA-98 / G3) TaxID=412133 RepID=A2G2J6_TRIV3|nr:keratin-associated protein family [Trichomonas vaginalis G3]EAX88620.1 hypothetical protein TVAG_167670 [Trichomonas vaginalis G3]KAI5485005.1 keratin-associated protein family [Trichomonas vaginalis G3]|eukprot:XP_001301550.1 hypothetical protein [Trichomonas vaginalis G3]